MQFAQLFDAAGQSALTTLDELERALAQPLGHSLVERCACLGARTDRLGHAFAGAYPLAVRALASDPRPTALAVTEERGNRPRDIDTVLACDIAGIRTVTGTKTFVSMADRASHCLVLAQDSTATPRADGRVTLVVAVVPMRHPSVAIALSPPLPMAPEIEHGRVTFTQTPVDDILPGDGWDDFARPFRTVEDVAVLSATIGMGVRLTRKKSPSLCVRAMALLTSLQEVERLGWSHPHAHLLLSGSFELARAALIELPNLLEGQPREFLLRDLPLLSIANKARAARTELAWQSFEKK